MVQSLEASISTMSILLSELSVLSTSLRSVSEPIIRRHYLLLLPTEILAHIRLCLAELYLPGRHCRGDAFNLENGYTFSLVCRRFRDIELSIPQLWTNAHDDMPDEYIRLVLSRSGNLGLKVQLTLSYNPFVACQNCDKWKSLLEHKHRWTNLTIKFHDSKGDHDCSHSLRNLDLPSLRELHIDRIHDIARNVISAWSLPNLCAITSCDLSTLLALPHTNPLSSLELRHEYLQMRTDKILRFLNLSTTEKLTYLVIVFNNPILGPEGAPCHPEVTLSMVKELRVTSLGNRYNFTRAVFPLLERLKCPNVELLSLKLAKEVILSDEFQEWAQDLVQSALNCVTIDVMDDLYGATEKKLTHIFGSASACSIVTSLDERKGEFSMTVKYKR
jgi:hypothetical protein